MSIMPIGMPLKLPAYYWDSQVSWNKLTHWKIFQEKHGEKHSGKDHLFHDVLYVSQVNGVTTNLNLLLELAHGNGKCPNLMVTGDKNRVELIILRTFQFLWREIHHHVSSHLIV